MVFSLSLLSQINIDISTQDASCSGKGSIQITATGGKSPYSYEITDNTCGLNNRPLQSNSLFSGLSSCTYTVRVIDAEGRTAFKNAMVGGNYVGPSASIQVDGCGFVINTKNGNAPIKYSISLDGGLSYGPASSQNIFNGLSNGTYYIKIEDACNSVFISSATISINAFEFAFQSTDLFKSTDSIRPASIIGGSGPFLFNIVNDNDTLKSNNNTFAIKDIKKTCSTKVLIQSPCGTYIREFDYVNSEYVCVNQTAGISEIKVNLGVPPYTIESLFPSSGTFLSYSDLLNSQLPKNELRYTYNLRDNCNHSDVASYVSNSISRPEFNFSTSNSCGELNSIKLKILQKDDRKNKFSIECSSCTPVSHFEYVNEGIDIKNLNTGKKTIIIKDTCGSVWECINESNLIIDEKCQFTKLYLINAFKCNNRVNGFSYSGDTIKADMYYLRTETGILIDSNKNGTFEGIINGKYLVQAFSSGCGLIQTSYNRNIVFQAPYYYTQLGLRKDDNKCQYTYFLVVEKSYYPYILIDESGLEFSAVPNGDFDPFFLNIKPGKYILKSLLNCWQKVLDLPLISPKLKLEKITVCPAGGSVNISGGKNTFEWWNSFNPDLNITGGGSYADWYSLSSRFSNHSSDTGRHTYFNIEPGKTYTIFMHSYAEAFPTNEENTCPVDSLTFTAPFYTPPSLQSDLTLKCDQSNTVLNQLKIKNGTTPYQIQEINCTNQSNISNSISTSDTIVSLNTNNLNNHCFKVTDVCQNSTTTESSIGDLNSNIQVLKNCNSTTTFYFSPIPGATYTWRNKINTVIGTQSSITTADPKIGDEFKLSLVYKGCTIAKSLIVDSLTARSFNVQITANKNLDLCFGDSIQLSTVVTGGVAPFQYNWVNGSQANQIVVKTSGLQTVVVTNGLGCKDTAAISIRIGQPLNLSYTKQDIACHGDSTGKITVKTMGGILPYKFKWTTGSTIDSISRLATGNYSLTLTDAAGCSISENIILSQNPKLNLDISATLSTCDVSKDGSAQVIASGGALGYSYLWNTGNNTNRVTNLNPGNYSVTVTDQALCKANTGIMISKGPEILSQRSDTLCAGSSLRIGNSVYSVTGNYRDTLKTIQGCDSVVATFLTILPIDVRISTDRPTSLCAGDSILLTAVLTGGTAPFSYSWTDGSKFQNAWIKNSGIKTLSVRDLFGCADTAQIAIQVGEVISILTSRKSIDCFGESTGAIHVQASGGIAPYRYLWSTGSQVDSIVGLRAGQYGFTLTDAASCTHVENFRLEENPKLSLTSIAFPSTCGVSKDGVAEIIPSGGTSGYSYQWNTGQFTNRLTNLNPGNYTVIVTDQALCQIQGAVTVLTGPEILHQRTDTICAGSGLRIGTSNYTISGNYRDTLKTVQGCDSIVLTNLTVNPFEVRINTNKQTDLCAGDSILFTTVLNGGLAPFRYNWTSGSLTNSAWIKTAGEQMVTVKDRLGCQDTAKLGIRIGEPLKMLYTKKSIACFGDSTGSIEIQTSGGLVPHRYLWSTGSMKDRISGLPAGQYGITLTDLANCSLSENFNLDQNPKLTLTSKTFQATCGVSKDGKAEITATGGQAGYTYQWSTGQNTSSLVNINPGNYSVTVTDQAFCQSLASIEVPRGPQIMSQRTDTICAGSSLRIGISIYTISGTFRDTLKSFQGCDSIVLTRLTVNDPLQYTLTSNNPLCSGQNNGSIVVSNLNGKSPYVFELNGRKINGLKADNLSSGNYTIKVTDGFGCYTEKGSSLSNPQKLELDAGKDTLLQFGDSIVLRAITNITSNEIKSLTWTSDQGSICTNCATTTVRPKKDIAIKVELENTRGCKIIDQFLVKVNLEFKVFAPNVIYLDLASSGSGTNSKFTIFSNQIQSIEYLRIFDRFGSLLFEVKNIPPGDINSGWDGTYHSQRVNPGVYVYLAKVRFVDESVKMVSGDVTVLN